MRIDSVIYIRLVILKSLFIALKKFVPGGNPDTWTSFIFRYGLHACAIRICVKNPGKEKDESK
jgi:hypothetical protein